MDVHRLHSSISVEIQRKAFQRPPPGTFKVVLSTNIAETSVTIDDCVFVIDTGRRKVMSYEGGGRIAALRDEWASKAACKQRSGRAGRVGRKRNCAVVTQFRFVRVSHSAFSSRPRFRHWTTPTSPRFCAFLCRALCCRRWCGAQPPALGNPIQSMGTKVPSKLLEATLNPPPSLAVTTAIDSLVVIGALSGGPAEWELTPLGKLLAQLPVDAALGKALIYGSVLRAAPLATDDCADVRLPADCCRHCSNDVPQVRPCALPVMADAFQVPFSQ